MDNLSVWLEENPSLLTKSMYSTTVWRGRFEKKKKKKSEQILFGHKYVGKYIGTQKLSIENSLKVH